MATRSRPRERVEPTFDGRRSDSDFRLDAGDRVAGGGSAKRTSSKGGTKQRAAKSRTGGRRKRARSGLLRSLVYWCVVMSIWVGIGIGGVVLFYGARMPSANTWAIPDRPPNVKIVTMDGNVIANRGITGGEALALDEMSPFIPEAVIAIEDRRFYSHFGVDPFGLARAFVNNLTNGRATQGGSTLTQQLAKNLFLSPERTLERKVQEVLLAFWLEHKFNKDQILAMYLNRVYFGSNAYGVEAASRRYFNKSAREVNLGEAALLAGLLKAPSRLSPARDPKAAQERAQVVLSAMSEEGFITSGEIKTAMSQPPTRAKSYWSGAGQYVADMVMDDVKALIGTIETDLVVETTIDLDLEKKAEAALVGVLSGEGRKLNAAQAALVSIDGSGAIRALVGGGDYATSQFNRAVKAKRQPGSAFKPFVYAAALEGGATPNSMRNDAPIRIGKWTPENYDEKYRGPVSLSDALANSLNTIAAQLVMEVGPDQVIKMARRLGIESEMQANASIALGTSEVSLLELTSAYAPFMNGGYKATPHVVLRIKTAEGKLLYDGNFENPPRVLSAGVVGAMNTMLSRVLTDGTGHNARLKGWQAAGKTGTTQSFRDALFVGYTSNLATGVWFGNDDGHSMKKVTGGGLPAKAWHNYMTTALEGASPMPLKGGDQPQAPANERTMDPVGALISNVFRGRDSYPEPPAAIPTDSQQTSSTTPVPPMDVGPSGPPVTPRRTTLLDVILGQ